MHFCLTSSSRLLPTYFCLPFSFILIVSLALVLLEVIFVERLLAGESTNLVDFYLGLLASATRSCQWVRKGLLGIRVATVLAFPIPAEDCRALSLT